MQKFKIVFMFYLLAHPLAEWDWPAPCLHRFLRLPFEGPPTYSHILFANDFRLPL